MITNRTILIMKMIMVIMIVTLLYINMMVVIVKIMIFCLDISEKEVITPIASVS